MSGPISVQLIGLLQFSPSQYILYLLYIRILKIKAIIKIDFGIKNSCIVVYFQEVVNLEIVLIIMYE